MHTGRDPWNLGNTDLGQSFETSSNRPFSHAQQSMSTLPSIIVPLQNMTMAATMALLVARAVPMAPSEAKHCCNAISGKNFHL